MLSFEDFVSSLDDSEAPKRINPLLKALWFDAKGFWDKAHRVVQERDDTKANWIHAYLHRKEGDQFNAAYWYGRCSKPMPEYDLRKEWEEITRSIIEQIL